MIKSAVLDVTQIILSIDTNYKLPLHACLFHAKTLLTQKQRFKTFVEYTIERSIIISIVAINQGHRNETVLLIQLNEFFSFNATVLQLRQLIKSLNR